MCWLFHQRISSITKKNIGNNLPYFFINSEFKQVSSEETIVNSEKTPVISEITNDNKNFSGNNPKI